MAQGLCIGSLVRSDNWQVAMVSAGQCNCLYDIFFTVFFSEMSVVVIGVVSKYQIFKIWEIDKNERNKNLILKKATRALFFLNYTNLISQVEVKGQILTEFELKSRFETK